MRRKIILLFVALALLTVMVAAPAYAAPPGHFHRHLPAAACNPGQADEHSPKISSPTSNGGDCILQP
jgi:hypothetical protein